MKISAYLPCKKYKTKLCVNNVYNQDLQTKVDGNVVSYMT